MRNPFRGRTALVVPAVACLTLPLACSAPSKGGLMLAISTDMQTPKDVNVVSVFISTNGTPKLDYLGRVLPDGTVALPATIAVVEPDSPNAEVRIRVIGFQEQKARVLRDVLTTVPHEKSRSCACRSTSSTTVPGSEPFLRTWSRKARGEHPRATRRSTRRRSRPGATSRRA